MVDVENQSVSYAVNKNCEIKTKPNKLLKTTKSKKTISASLPAATVDQNNIKEGWLFNGKRKVLMQYKFLRKIFYIFTSLR